MLPVEVQVLMLVTLLLETLRLIVPPEIVAPAVPVMSPLALIAVVYVFQRYVASPKFCPEVSGAMVPLTRNLYVPGTAVPIPTYVPLSKMMELPWVLEPVHLDK